MYETAERLVMPPFPVDRFLAALDEVVTANEAFVPPMDRAPACIFGYMYGSGAIIGVAPSPGSTFRIFTAPRCISKAE